MGKRKFKENDIRKDNVDVKDQDGNKGRNYRGKGKGKKDDFNPRYPRKNDPSWYTKFPELAKVSSFINYGIPTGQTLTYGAVVSEDGLEQPTAVSGIMKLSILPSIGLSLDNNSAVNNMSRMIYSFIRHANSGSRNYESQDLMTYYLALGSAYAFYASIVRLYGILRSVSVDNLYIPKSYCEILKCDYTDLISHLADLRSYIGYFAARINQFAAPKDMAYFEHMMFMPLNIFMDYDDPKASLYLFDFDRLFIWTGTEFETGSGLITTDWGIREDKTFEDIVSVGEEIINSLTLNEDIGMMSGDTLKAYGSAGIHEIPVISDDYITMPIYDENILWQIHNATIIDWDTGSWEDWNVKQQGTALIFNPTRTVVGSSQFKLFPEGMERILDSGSREPSVEENLENTRLHCRVKYVPTSVENTYKAAFVTMGSIVVTTATAYYFYKNYDDIALELGEGYLWDVAVNPNIEDQFIGVINRLFDYAHCSCFRHKPLVYLTEVLNNSIGSILPLGDVHNFTITSHNQIDQLHRTALLSEFYVPNMAQAYK